MGVIMAIWIYHFTHRENLSSILAAGAFLCDRSCKHGSLTRESIGYSNLKRRRMHTRVEVAPGGTLGDYVPFYFGTKSPMLLTYRDGNVTGKPENQDDIIYFATTVEHIVERQLPYAFTDGHPVQEPKAFFNNIIDIGHVDLSLMTKPMWNDTDSDPDRMRRRQAEFLVHQQLDWSDVQAIGVRTVAIRDYIRSTWYYPDKPGR
jgi:hypothetical protein